MANRNAWTIFILTIAVVLLLGGMALVLTNVTRLESDRASQQDQSEWFRKQMSVLVSERRALRDGNLDMSRQLAAAKERVAAAEKNLETEHATNEPLRGKVAAMMAKTIDNEAQLTRHTQSLQDASTSLTQAQARVAELTTARETLTRQVGEAQAKNQELEQSVTGLRASVAQAQEKLAALGKQLADATAKLKPLQDELAAKSKAVEQLTADLAAAKAPPAPAGR